MFGHIADLELYNGRNRYWDDCHESATMYNRSAVPPTRWKNWGYPTFVTPEAEFCQIFILQLGGAHAYDDMRRLLNERFLAVRHTRLGFDVWNYKHTHSLSRATSLPGEYNAMCVERGGLAKAASAGGARPCENWEQRKDMTEEGGYMAEACRIRAFDFDCSVDPTAGKYSGVRDRKEGNLFWCTSDDVQRGRCNWGNTRSTAECIGPKPFATCSVEQTHRRLAVADEGASNPIPEAAQGLHAEVEAVTPPPVSRSPRYAKEAVMPPLGSSFPGAAHFHPVIHFAPPIVSEHYSWHDIAGAVTHRGTHHVWQGTGWNHATSTDLVRWQAGAPGPAALNETYAGMESHNEPCSGFVTTDPQTGALCAGFRQCDSQRGVDFPGSQPWDVPLELRCALDDNLTKWSTHPDYLFNVSFWRNVPYDPARPWREADGYWYVLLSFDACNVSSVRAQPAARPDVLKDSYCAGGGQLVMWRSPALRGPAAAWRRVGAVFTSNATVLPWGHLVKEFVTIDYIGRLQGDPSTAALGTRLFLNNARARLATACQRSARTAAAKRTTPCREPGGRGARRMYHSEGACGVSPSSCVCVLCCAPAGGRQRGWRRLLLRNDIVLSSRASCSGRTTGAGGTAGHGRLGCVLSQHQRRRRHHRGRRRGRRRHRQPRPRHCSCIA